MSEPNGDFIFDNFDLSDDKLKGWDGKGGGMPEIPPGEYLFEVVSCRSVPTNAGDGKNLHTIFRVVDGEYIDKEVQQWFLHASDKIRVGHKRRIKHVFVNVLGVPLTPSGGFDGKEVIGRRMYATVVWETSKKYNPGEMDPTRQYTEFTNAKLECERAYDGEQPTTQSLPEAPAVPAPAPQRAVAPSAPPRTPPAAPPRPPARGR